ncbi:MAG: hypothetical protein E2O53_08830 [Gammaproteobacteria bacterium]|nr:MAG: hypothetical protein E2O53_08830 [Gammaproteobacteria bacterium]
MKDTKMEAAVIFETHLPDALRRALEYAGDDGFVASMPQLLHARVNADFNNEIWDTWFFTTTSEESAVTTPQGNHVAVVVHGGGIFSTPERFRKLYLASVDRSSKDGFTGLFGAKILEKEAHDLLVGKLPDGTEFPVFPFDEFKRGVADLPRRYAVVMDFELARTSKCGYASFADLKDDPLMIVRAGGVEAAARYLDKAKEFYGTTEMGSWHRFDDLNPDQPQTWVQFLFDCLGGASDKDSLDPASRQQGDADAWFTHYRVSRDSGFGLRGDMALINTARYIAVAPRNSATGVRDLPFVA